MSGKVSVQYNSKSYAIPISADMTVSQFLDKVNEIAKVTAVDETLICKGKKITRSDAILSDEGIVPNSKVMLVTKGPPKNADSKGGPPQLTQVPGFRRPSYFLGPENLSQAPHWDIISREPPPDCVAAHPGKAALPKNPFVVYTNGGAVAKLTIETDALWVQPAEGAAIRIFFHEIKASGVQECPGANRYWALYVVTAHEKHWFYFIPGQYSDNVSEIVRTG
jgi:hypothetical protein